MKIGVEVRDSRNAEFARGQERRPTQRPFGDYMHDVGPLRAPGPEQPFGPDDPDLQFRVIRNPESGSEPLLEARRLE